MNSYQSTTCKSGHHTECITGPDMDFSRDVCICDCHHLSGEAREVLTSMCESAAFRDRMMKLVFAAMGSEAQS